MGTVRAWVVGVALWSGAAWAAPPPPSFPLGPCSRKRVDPCGCHHVYGLRHCHPNRKTPHCELPARAASGLASGRAGPRGL